MLRKEKYTLNITWQHFLAKTHQAVKSCAREGQESHHSSYL